VLRDDAGGAVKRALRAQRIAARSALTASQIDDARADVRAHVLARFTSSGCVAAYRPMRTEPGSVELLDALATSASDVIVPLLRDDLDLDWTPWPDGDPLGMDAVALADVVLVPALAVDRHGVRLGRGGGSYDRALRRVRDGVPIVALLYDSELADELPADPWDTGVTAVITPSGWHPLG
jgi:5-formyltetrahydrofolate cyclo-ligase